MATSPTSASRGAIETLSGRVIFGLFALFLYLVVELWNSLGTPFGPGTCAALAYVFFALHLFFVRGRISGFDPIIWIPVAMLLFYFGLPITNEVINRGNPIGYNTWEAGLSPNLERGFAAHVLSFAAFLFGTHLAGTRDLSGGPGTSKPDPSLKLPSMIMLFGALGMIAIGVALVGPSVVFGTYDVWWDAKSLGADARGVDIGLVFAMSGIFGILATDDGRRGRRYFALGMAGLIGLLLILKGDRSHLIGLGMGVGWCYSQRVRRISPTLVFALAFLALMAVPLLKEFREWRTIEYASSSSPRQLLAATFGEMGSSAMAFVYTLDFIPSESPYRWGMSYLGGALELVPNFGLTPGKSFVLTNVDYSPSAWITRELAPAWFDMGGGFGYSMDAEAYFNFGMPAVLIGMTFFGWLTARVRNSSQGSALKLVWSAMFLAAMSMYVRNIFGYPLKVAVWPIVGLFTIRFFLSLLGGSQPRTTSVPPIESDPSASARV